MTKHSISSTLARIGAGMAATALLGTVSVGAAAADEAGPDPEFWVVPVSKTTSTSPNRTTIVARIHMPPGGGVDWHRHPGLTSVTVEGEGRLTLVRQNCTSSTYPSGETFSPPLNWHTARNFSDKHVVAFATFVVRGDKPTLMADQPLDDNLDRRCGLSG